MSRLTEPFIMVPKCILKMPAALLQVWIAIRFFDWQKKGREREGCDVTAAEIGETIDMSERMVRVHLHRLELCGAIRRVERPGRPYVIFCTPDTYDQEKLIGSEAGERLHHKNPARPRKEIVGVGVQKPSGADTKTFRGSENEVGRKLQGFEQFPSGVPVISFRPPLQFPSDPYIEDRNVDTVETVETLAGGLAPPPRTQGELIPLEPAAKKPPTRPRKTPKPPPPPALSASTWEAYRGAYERRYGIDPVRNAAVNSKLKQLVERLGAAAPEVAAFYLTHSSAFYVQKLHQVGPLLADAEKLHTEMLTGNKVTGLTARHQEQTASNYFAQEALRLQREQDKGE